MMVLQQPAKAGAQPDAALPPLYAACQHKMVAAMQKAIACDFK